MSFKRASTYCKFGGCSNNSSLEGKHFFRIPKDPIRCEAWIRACNNPKLKGIPAEKHYATSYICGDHFHDWCFMNLQQRNRLVHNAVPATSKLEYFLDQKITIEEDSYKNLPENSLPKKSLDDDAPSSLNTDNSSESLCDEDNDIASTDHYNKKLNNSKLREEATVLYHGLVQAETAEKVSMQKYETEIKSLKKELQDLKEADTKKIEELRTRVEELTTENENLKKSFCSLYKTVSAEIKHKDNLLAEANSRLDNARSHRSSKINRQTKIHSYEEADNLSHKRKRSPSPKLLSNVKEPQSSSSKPNNVQAISTKRTRRDATPNSTLQESSRSRTRYKVIPRSGHKDLGHFIPIENTKLPFKRKEDVDILKIENYTIIDYLL